MNDSPEFEPQRKASDFLEGNHFIKSRLSPQTQRILGCLGCSWNRTEDTEEGAQVRGINIVKCTGISYSVVQPALQGLVQTGLVERVELKNPDGKKGRAGILYVPSGRKEAEYFRQNIVVPAVCNQQN